MKKLIFLLVAISVSLASCQTYRYSVNTDKQIVYLEKQISLTERKISLEERNLPKGSTSSTMLELHKQNLVNYNQALTEAIKASGGKQVSIRSNNAYGSAMFAGATSVKSISSSNDLEEKEITDSECNLLIQNRYLSSSRQLDEKNTVSFKVVSVEVVGLNKSKLVESNTWGVENINPARSHEVASGQLAPEENLVISLPAGTYVVYFYRLGKSYYKTLTLNPMHDVFVSDKDLAGTGVKQIHGFAYIKRK
ncbi:hypothetical protein EOL94_03185 [bacterium]|nr:hypothetical protein [bacterium]